MFAKNRLFSYLVSHWPLTVCCLCLRHDFEVEPTPTESHRTCWLQHCWSVLRDRKNKQTNNKFWIFSGKSGSFDQKNLVFLRVQCAHCDSIESWELRFSVIMWYDIIWECGLSWRSMFFLFVSFCVCCLSFSSENFTHKPPQTERQIWPRAKHLQLLGLWENITQAISQFSYYSSCCCICFARSVQKTPPMRTKKLWSFPMRHHQRATPLSPLTLPYFFWHGRMEQKSLTGSKTIVKALIQYLHCQLVNSSSASHCQALSSSVWPG